MSISEWKSVFTEKVIKNEKRSLISGPFGSNIGRKFFVEKGIPVIRGNNLSLDKGLKFNDTGFVFVKEEKAQELGAWAIKNDIIFTAAGTIGQVGILKDTRYERYIISNKQIRLRLNTNIVNPLFAYYWYSSDIITREIINNNTGSTIPLINLSIIKSLPISLPPLPEQKAIADSLSCLDDKIELNNRINKTLEEMAQAIFKSWFVDFEPFQDGEFEDSEIGRIPKGWRVGLLGEIFDFKNGKKRPATTGIYPVYGGNGVLGFSNEYNNENVVVIGRVGAYCGSLFFESNKCWISDNAISAKSKRNCIAFCYYTLKRLKLNERRIGTGQPLLTQSILTNIIFTIPRYDVIKAFENSISPLLKLIDKNVKENLILTDVRDSLLPKLMSGEIIVPIEEVQ